MNYQLYQRIATRVQAMENCRRSGNEKWLSRHRYEVEQLVKRYMPSGSGVDVGTLLDLDKSSGDRLVFNVSFHHMDDGGGYDGWTQHVVTVRPSLIQGIAISISGSDRNFIKAYLSEMFETALKEEISEAQIARQPA